MSIENNNLLTINELEVSVAQKTILSNISLEVAHGSLHALMGPNGSGKSTLAYTLMGHPAYTVAKGSICYDGKTITQMPMHKRARAGIFLAFQHPYEIPGVSIATFLKESYQAVTGSSISVKAFNKKLLNTMEQLAIDPSFIYRNVNEGFSGGEKKRFEMLQACILSPRLLILDEIDSGLDVDALKVVAQGLCTLRAQNPAMAVIMVTHYHRLFDSITPDYVHIMSAGKLVQSGSAELAKQIEIAGYETVAN